MIDLWTTLAKKFLSILYWGCSTGESSIHCPDLIRVTLRRLETPQKCKDSSLFLCLLPKILQGKETVTVLNKSAMNAWRQCHSPKSSEMPWFSCLIEEMWTMSVLFVEIQCAVHQQRILNWVLHSLLIFGDLLTSWGCQDMWFAHIGIFW